MDLAATGPKLYGPQVSIKHGAGQMPGPELRQPFQSACPVWPSQPSANSSPALAADQGTCSFTSLPSCSCPALFLTSLLPLGCPAPLHRGWSRGPWGSQGTWAQVRNRLLLRPFLPKEDQLKSPGKSSLPSRGQEWASHLDNSLQRRPIAHGSKSNTVAIEPSQQLCVQDTRQHWASGSRTDVAQGPALALPLSRGSLSTSCSLKW